MSQYAAVSLADLNVLVWLGIGFGFFRFCVRRFFPGVPINISSLAYLGHMAFAFLFYLLSLGPLVGDSNRYFDDATLADSWGSLLGWGTSFVGFLCYPLVQYFNFSFLSLYGAFGTLSFIGIFLFYVTVREIVIDSPRLRKWSIAILFFPGLNFWTGVPGKDAIVIFCTGLILFSLQDVTKRWGIITFALAFVFFTRPHIALVNCLAFGVLFLTGTVRSNIVVRLVVLMIMVVVGIKAFGLVAEKVKLTTLDGDAVKAYLEHRQTTFQNTGSFVDLTGQPLVMKMFAFLYRPTIIEARSVIQLFAAMENIILLLLSLRLCRPSFLRFIRKENTVFTRFNIFFFLIATVILSTAIYNLGLATRQKMMVIPSLIVVIASYEIWLIRNRETKQGALQAASTESGNARVV